MLIYSLFILLIAVARPLSYIKPIFLIRLVFLVFTVSVVMVSITLYPSWDISLNLYCSLVHVSFLSQIIVIIILISSVIVIICWAPITIISHNSTQKINTAIPTSYELPLIIIFTVIGAIFIINSNSLVLLYLSIELKSFAVYVIAALYRESESSTGAGLKYFILGGLSSCIILLGIGLIYASTGVTTLDAVFSLLEVNINETLNTSLGPVALGLTLMSSGILFKVGSAPFHNWAPDVYDGVPTNITIWINVLPKLALLGLLAYIADNIKTSINFEVLGIGWKTFVLLCSFLSLTAGAVYGLAEVKIKRLLAYSTISHIGFILILLPYTTASYASGSFVFYLIQYTLTTIDAFLIVLAIGYITKGTRYNETQTDLTLLSDLKGQTIIRPALGLSFAVCLFSIAGVPPLVGFVGKAAVLKSSLIAGNLFISIVAVVVSVITGSYYLKLIRLMTFNISESSTNEPSTTLVNGQLGIGHTILIAVLTLVQLFFILDSDVVLITTDLIGLRLNIG